MIRRLNELGWGGCRKIAFGIVIIVIFLGGCANEQPLPKVPTASPIPIITPTISPTATPISVQGTVSIWHSWDELRLPALLKRIAAFQDVYPNVQFDVLYVPPLDLLNSYRQACIDGYAPALLIGPSDWKRELYNEDCILPLDSLIDTNLLTLLNPASVAASRHAGLTLGVPLHMDGVVLYRNPRLVPIEAATFDELVEYSQTAINEEGSIGAFFDRSPYFSGGHLYGLGGSFFGEDGSPNFYDEYGLSWIRLLQNFERVGPVDYFSDQDYEQFIAGKAAYLIETTQRRGDIQATSGEFGFVIDPWPILEQGEMAGFIQTESAYLHPRVQSEPYAVTLLFVESLLSLEGQIELAEMGLIPVYSSSSELGLTSRVQIFNPLIAQAMIALANGVPYPPEFAEPEFRATLDTYLQAIFAGELEPGDGLQQAAAIMESQHNSGAAGQ